MEHLGTVWFVLIAVLWTGYLFLEGFDLGVGMHMRILARNETERRQLLNTIGPVWDGNEVWLITAGGATFAAFPFWYASLFSTLYIPLLAVLAGLIFRAVSIEYRGKVHSDRWRNMWTWAMALGSLVAASGIGAGLALTTTGLPIDGNGDREGGWFSWFSIWAVVGALAVTGFCLVHAAAFLALKTEGEIRVRARQFLVRMLPILLVPIVFWVLAVFVMNDATWTLAPIALAAVAVAYGWLQGRRDRELPAFLGLGIFLIAGVTAIFGSVYPVVLPSTLNVAFDLTVSNASSSAYTLRIMSIVAAFGLPIVLAYQAWTYWVFRKRIGPDHIPDAHSIIPAVLRAKPAE